MRNLSALSWREQVTFNKMTSDDVHFVLDLQVQLYIYNARSQNQPSSGKHVAQLGHLILFLNHHFTFVNYIQVKNRIRISATFLKLCTAFLNSCSLGFNSCDFSETFEKFPIWLFICLCLAVFAKHVLNGKINPLYYYLSFLHIYGKQSKT